MRSLTNILFIAAFGLILVTPVVLQFVGVEMHYIENKKFKEPPTLHGDRFRKYIYDFDQYYKQNFGGRPALLATYNKFNISVLKTSPNPNFIVLGKDGWMFLSNDADNVMNQTLRYDRYNPSLLDSIARNWNETISTFKSIKIPLYTCVAPNKHRIYPQFLPDRLQSNLTSVDSKLSQVQKRLASESNTPNILDLKSGFPPQSKLTPFLYHKMNSHWNDLGAYYGYVALMKTIKNNFPDVTILALDQFKQIYLEKKDLNFGQMLQTDGIEKTFVLQPKFNITSVQTPNQLTIPEGVNYEYELRFKNTNATCKYKLLVFRDSFTDALVPFLSESFSEVVLISSKTIDYGIVERENPDLVVYEMVERRLDNLLLNP